jgi:hypothetical protein
MAADIKAIAFVLLGAGQPANQLILLEYNAAGTVPAQFVGGGEPRWSGADDDGTRQGMWAADVSAYDGEPPS